MADKRVLFVKEDDLNKCEYKLSLLAGAGTTFLALHLEDKCSAIRTDSQWELENFTSRHHHNCRSSGLHYDN